MECGATVCDPYQKYNSSMYARYCSVSDMLDELGWPPLSQRRQEARLILLKKLLTVWHKCPSKAYLLRRIRALEEKHNIKFRQIGHTTSQYGQSFFPKTISVCYGLLSLKLCH